MKRPPLKIFYASTALSVTTLGDSLLYTILPSYYPLLGLAPLHVGILLSVNRWVRLGTNHIAEHCYRNYPSPLWLILALFTGSVVTGIYSIAKVFIILLGARILWGVAFSFIRQATIMTVIRSSPDANLGERMGYFRGIDTIWRTSGILLGGLSHDAFGFSATFIALSIVSLVGIPLGTLSQKGLGEVETPLVESGSSWKGNTGIILCGFAVGIVGPGVIMSTLGLVLKEQVGEVLVLRSYSLGVATLTGIILGLYWLIDGIGSPILGAIADRMGKERSVLFLFAVGTLALIFGGFNRNWILLGILVLLIFMCNATLYTLLSAQVGRAGTRPLATFATALDLGSSFGPLLGWSIAQLGFRANYVFLLCGTMYAIGAIVSLKKSRFFELSTKTA